MVRREGSRFGVATSQHVRRLPFPHQQTYSEQNIVIETKINTEEHQLKKWAKASVKKQMKRGGFHSKDDASPSVRFSLNKAKRWEIIEDIKNDDHCHDNHSIITEHHVLYHSRIGTSPGRCTEVFDSAADDVRRTPKKRYANVADLMGMQREEKTINVDEDFGKKNRRRSRKKRANLEEAAPLSTVQYAVSVAAPRHTYQTYCKTKVTSGIGQRKKNSRNRTQKLSSCNIQDGQWELEEERHAEDRDCDEEEVRYWQEETREACPYQCNNHALETLLNKALSKDNAVKRKRAPSQRPQPWGTKDRIFPIEEADAIIAIHPEYVVPVREKRKAKKQRIAQGEKEKMIENQVPKLSPNPVSTLPKPSALVSVKSSSISDAELNEMFGDCYTEGLSVPRRIAINITDIIVQQLRTRSTGQDFADTIVQSGHRVFTILDCMLDPWLTMKNDHSLMEDVRVKVSGVDESHDILTCALSGLGSSDISEVISAVSQSIAALPSESYLIDDSISSQPAKPVLAVDTIQSALGWRYNTTTLNKAMEKKAQDHEGAHGGETLLSCGTHVAPEPCGICYEEPSETCPGTALASCHHWFCDECWKGHMTARVDRGDTNMTCPGFGCTAQVDMVTMMSLLPSSYYTRHQGHRMNRALTMRPELHWCPAPSCGRLLRLASRDADAKAAVHINCQCGTFWCSGCKKEAHWPATCQQAELYWKNAKDLLKKRKAEIESIVRVNTKPCPKCHYPIEKYYGCNHLLCKCGYEFCWQCGGNFKNYVHKCRREIFWKYQVFMIHPEDLLEKSALELAVMHHRRRTHFACHRRMRKARKLAFKLDAHSRIESKVGDAASLSSPSSSMSMAARAGRSGLSLDELKRIMSDAAHFLSEAEFVLEHLEILLSSTPHSKQKRVLTQHKSRLIFITDHGHQIFNEKAKLDIDKIQHLVHCGKNCLRWIAAAATHLTAVIVSSSSSSSSQEEEEEE